MRPRLTALAASARFGPSVQDQTRHSTAADKGKVTLELVAARAGVSPSTVSRILNGTAIVSDDKQEAVDRAIASAVARNTAGVDSLLACADGLFHSYNLVDVGRGGAALGHLYPMLEGQAAILSCGWLPLADAVRRLDALFASDLHCPRWCSFMLHADRRLPGFLERSRLDAAALQLPVVRRRLEDGRSDLLAAGADLGREVEPLAQAYGRVLEHQRFTGRSGTMFGYEGLGCIHGHMVARLLLAVQERVFEAADRAAPELPALVAHYRRVRDGLGHRKDAAAWGAFPTDPYSHTPAEGGAQQPGTTGQVKEEILARWGELGLRVEQGRVRFDPVLLDEAELRAGATLTFTWARVPYAYRRGSATQLRMRTAQGWIDCPDPNLDPSGVQAVEAEVLLDRARAAAAAAGYRGSEAESFSGVPEQRVKTTPI